MTAADRLGASLNGHLAGLVARAQAQRDRVEEIRLAAVQASFAVA